ncbi:MAG: class I SAM-dependent methyltransferase [Chitinophagia bacterium]|nr:class I SAM-dependent methyltransferase [Chitinophagia bacterium]NCA30574.1 class I SAM-dependent methyltransferase [Chitinophagia bacterium]
MKKSSQIDGWFDFKDTYHFLLSQIPDSGIFVECGAWLGKSSSYLCDIAKNTQNIFIVDTWQGSLDPKDPTHITAQDTNNIFEIFLDNMGDRKFIPIKKLSTEASKDFKDNSCDVIFIDMTHTYEQVKQDINVWLPKVKIGGYIAGHDYQKDWPDVIRAVNEIFGSDNLLLMDTCWIYHKNE